MSSNNNPSKSIRVCFAPKFTSINPYQDNLVSSLKCLDVEMNGVSSYKLYLPKQVNIQKAEILHLHWLHRFYHKSKSETSVLIFLKFIVGLIHLKIKGVKIVWTAHNIKNHENENKVYDFLCNFFVANISDAIIVHSHAAKEKVAQACKLRTRDKIAVIPHASYIGQYKNDIDRVDARKKLNIAESKIVFLSFGLIRAYKGILELSEAFEDISEENAYLLIAGEPRDKELTSIIESKSKNGSNIQVVPKFIPEDDVQLYFKAADVAVFPYRQVLTSGAVLLAMSFGCACLAPREGCITEILDDSGAFLYDPDDVFGISKAMQSAILSSEKIESMGYYNLQLAKSWTWEKVAKQTKDIYLSCLL